MEAYEEGYDERRGRETDYRRVVRAGADSDSYELTYPNGCPILSEPQKDDL